MPRVYLADAQPEERSALRLLLQDLKMEVVGEAADWATALAQAPATRLDMLVVDWSLLPTEVAAGLSKLRAACSGPIVVVLISHLDARQQAALSSGADVFISKGEMPERVAERLQGAAESVWEEVAIHKTALPATRSAAESRGSLSKRSGRITMNKDEFEGQWKQIRGQARQWWGKLTDDDLERVGGKFEQFAGVLQEKYGYTREAAEEEINKRLAQFEAKQKHNKQSRDRTPAQDIVTGKWKQMHGQARVWWGKLTDDDLDKTAGKAEAVIGLIQEKYGYSRGRAEAEFRQRVKEYEAGQPESAVPATP